MQAAVSHSAPRFLKAKTTRPLSAIRAVAGMASAPTAKLSEDAIRERAKAALLGGIIADAATMGLHWIYKPEVMQAAIAQRPSSATAPEFHEPPACPFYKSASGELSPYGYELFALTKYLASASGAITAFDSAACAKSLAESYTASTGYLNKSSKYIQSAVAEGKADKSGHPEDAQANAFVKAPAIVALLAGNPSLSSVDEAAVRVQQDNTPAVQAGLAGAKLLERVVLGSTVSEAVEWLLSGGAGVSHESQEQVKAALACRDAPYTEAVSKLGVSCGLPGSLQGVVVGGVKFPSYVEGVRANILAGGDNASRAVLLGALLAAQEGSVDKAIPAEWRAKTLHYKEYETLADKLIARRG